ncbi:MAG: transglycosylase domain-containing protein, partial [Coriobacteriia bacterium]|nr:transglycosylase domain-containing protein [Coriobacteriia bacterium]
MTVALASVCLIGVAGVVGTMSVVTEWAQDLPTIDANAFKYSEKTRVYADDRKTLLAEFYLRDQEPVTQDQVCNYVLKGTVATEDERFYEHDGVDMAGIARALVNNVLGGDLEGASTITQQLVRNTILSNEANDISLKRKIREASLAMEMEKQYTKDEILMMYLNTINYGDGCYGIEAAARHYFQKSASDLSLTQAATLIGIPQSPTYNNPVTNPDRCLERRNLVLDRMLSNGIISKEKHDRAKEKKLNLNLAKKKSDDGIRAYPYFTSYVREQLLEQLSYEDVFSGGLEVYTTLDIKMQQYADDAAEQVYADMRSSGDGDVELAMTCVDPTTGYIKCMIGGKNYKKSQFNLATNSTGRQAGSSFKTFTLAAAIEQGINPKSRVDCSSSDTINGWHVENYGGSDYGVRSIEQATWVSSNTGYAHLITDEDGVSPQSLLEMANRLGVSGTSGFGAYPALTLGVAQVNTTMMAGAYATFAADGMHYNTSCITEIKDSEGNVVLDNTDPEGTQALTPEVSYAVTKVLEGVVKHGTAKGAALSSGQASAGKTGTSENWRDLWYCGYTPQLSTAVWTGADPERSMWSASWCRDMW